MGTPSNQILLLTADEKNFNTIKKLLSGTVFNSGAIQWTDDIDRAIDFLGRHPFDAFLLDLDIEDDAGAGVLNNGLLNNGLLNNIIRQTSQVPVIILTDCGGPNGGSRFIQEGAQDYLCKSELDGQLLEHSIRFAIERHRMLRELEQRRNQLADDEKLFRSIIDKNADGMVIVDHSGRIKLINPAAEKITGKKTHDIAGKLLDYIGGDFQVTDDAIVAAFPCRTGEDALLEIRLVPIQWEGEPAYLACLRDVSERKKLEKDLLIEKERLDIALRSIGDGVIATDKNGCVVMVNRVAEEMTGQSREKIKGRKVDGILNITLKENCVIPDDCVERVADEKHDFSYGVTLLGGTSGERVIEYSCAPIFDKQRDIIGYVFVIRDITVRQKMAEQMLKVKKLDSLGSVASKLAHEYDNVLTVLLGNIAITKNKADSRGALFRMLDKAEKSTARARELTTQLHGFARQEETRQKRGSIVTLLQEVVQEQLTAPLISCKWNVPRDLWPVEFNRDLMFAALGNIVRNAVESMSMGGELDIRMENVLLSERMYYPLKSGSYIKIVITDSGKGMANEILQKIFDPFFTTRKDATGIGLSSAFSIIRKHEGTIEAESQIGKGSTFTLILPAAVSSGHAHYIKNGGQE